MNTILEPKIHSHIEDTLPDDHPRAYESWYCNMCGEMIHAFNNECMQTWVETGVGGYCIKCFAKIEEVESLETVYGLEELPRDKKAT